MTQQVIASSKLRTRYYQLARRDSDFASGPAPCFSASNCHVVALACAPATPTDWSGTLSGIVREFANGAVRIVARGDG
jgi:hypothetical protein